MGRRVVAEWSGVTTPAEVIAGWTSLSRMGSVAVDPVRRQEILAELQAGLARSWAISISRRRIGNATPSIVFASRAERSPASVGEELDTCKISC